MSNNNFSSKTSFLLPLIFLLVITISMTLAPFLSNSSFLIPNTSIRSSTELAYAQSDGKQGNESLPSPTNEVEDLEQEQVQQQEEKQLQNDDNQAIPSIDGTTTAPDKNEDLQQEQQDNQTGSSTPTSTSTPTPPSSSNNQSTTIENETTSSGDDNLNNENNTSTPIAGGPDRDCLFNPELPKCAAVDGECPDGFNQNEDEKCVPEGGCPDGYHTVDDDESGRCIPNSDGCPSGMIFRPDGKTCGYKEELCQDDPQLEGCIETPQECDNNRDDDSDGLIDSADPDCKVVTPPPSNCDPSYPDRCLPSPPPTLDCKDIIYRNFQVNSSADPHGFDKDKDGIGCETKSDSDSDDSDNEDQTGTSITSSTITVPQDTCSDATGIVKLGPGQIDSQAVRIVAFFDKCELTSAYLLSNYTQNENLKLVVANFDEKLSDAAELIQTPIQQQSNQNQVVYEVTITSNQQGYDLETGELKTINNVNGIILWNDGDVPVEFDGDDVIEVTLDFFN